MNATKTPPAVHPSPFLSFSFRHDEVLKSWHCRCRRVFSPSRNMGKQKGNGKGTHVKASEQAAGNEHSQASSEITGERECQEHAPLSHSASVSSLVSQLFVLLQTGSTSAGTLCLKRQCVSMAAQSSGSS